MVEPKQIKRSNRKTLSILVSEDGELIVSAPKRMSDARIFEFIRQKEKWINEKITQAKQTKTLNPTLKLVEGEKLCVFGKVYTLAFFENRSAKMIGDVIFLPKEKTREKLVELLKKKAFENIYPLANAYAKTMGLSFDNLKITSAKGRWGSCTVKKVLNFSYHLILCPEPVVEYVVVHELAHLRHMNHQKGFWDLVEAYLPNYRVPLKYLKINHGIMNII